MAACTSLPLVSDYRQQHITGADGVLDALVEVDSRLDRIDVHEDGSAAEPIHEPVVQATGVPGRVIASVADEDPGH
jgi:hypothetical protein